MKSIKYHLTIEHLWGLTALVGIFIFVNTHPIRPHDFWWHITIGREILTSSYIPTTDIYSYTAYGQSYPSYQMFWLMDIILYGIYKAGGPALVIFIHSLVITSAYFVLFWICKKMSNSWRIAAFGVLFAAALGLNDWNVRPQGITFLLGSLYLLAIYEYQQSYKWGWLVIFPLGMLIWVNSHGTFLIGLVLIGIWLGWEAWNLSRSSIKHDHEYPPKRLLVPSIVLGITALTCLINPRGLGILIYLKTLTGNPTIQNLVTEWAPPTINSFMGVIFYIGLLGTIIVIALSPKRPNVSQVVTLVIFGLLAIQTSRGIVWFGLVIAPALAEHLSFISHRFRKDESRPMNSEGNRFLNIIFSVMIIAMGVITLPWFKNALPFPQAKAGLISSETPIQATEFMLNENPSTQVFNAISFGSYLIWSAYPQYQVFVDSRIELFPEKVWMDYLNISNANGGWEALLKEYGVNTLMLSPFEQPALIAAVQKGVEWTELYRDSSAVIYISK